MMILQKIAEQVRTELNKRILLSIPKIPMIEHTLVNGESEMLSITAKHGELVTRIDIGKTYMLTAEPASILENWSELSLNEEPVVITKCSYCKGEKILGKQCPGCGAR